MGTIWVDIPLLSWRPTPLVPCPTVGGQGSLWGKKDPGHRQLIPSQSCSGRLTFDSPKALRTEPGSKENQNLVLQELILCKER